MDAPVDSAQARHNQRRKEARQRAKEKSLKLPRTRHCACGRLAVEKRRGDWACTLCLHIEERQEKDRRRQERNHAWRKVLELAGKLEEAP